MVLRNGKLHAPCKRCGKVFPRWTRFNRICTECCKKALKRGIKKRMSKKLSLDYKKLYN